LIFPARGLAVRASPEGQAAIAGDGIDGPQLFFPDAEKKRT
jgi:hypothetical protein